MSRPLSLDSLPRSQEAEEAVVGACLIHGAFYHLAAALVQAGALFSPPLAKVWAALGRCHAAGVPIDLITVSEELARSGDIGHLAINLERLADRGVPSEDLLLAHARIVAEKAQAREAMRQAHRAADEAAKGDLEGAAQSAERAKRAARPAGGRRRKPPPAPRPGARVFERGDDVELAQALLEELQAQHGRVLFTEGDFYRYDEAAGIWTAYDLDDLRRRLHGHAGALVQRQGAALKVLQLTDNRARGALSCARSEVGDRLFFADAPAGISFANCFLQVQGQDLLVSPHSADHRARARLPYPYHPDAACALWGRFLADVWRGDIDLLEKVAFLQEFVGACMLGLAPRYERTTVLIGTGANGKSRLIAVVVALFLPANVTSIGPQNFGKEYYRARLRGSLLNVLTELPAREILETEAFKAVCSGDVIDGREPGGQVFTYRPRAGLLFAANELPPISDPTAGPWRRLVPLEFNRSFDGDPAADPEIAERIVAAERPGIAAWAMEGARRLLRTGCYTTPGSSLARRAAWRRDSDQVLQWALEELDCTPEGYLRLNSVREPLHAHDFPNRGSDLYQIYRKWAVSNGHGALAINKWAARMKLLGARSVRFSDSNRWNVTIRSGMPENMRHGG